MALEGTIKDFALPDIFQLIGIQRKTGILTLSHQRHTVTIKFLEGSVVEADTASESLENRLGTVLVRTGRITEDQLGEALEIQRSTLQRLGHVLVKRGFISQDELVDALQIQSSQVIYRLFRWREGSYHFDPVEKLDYDQTHSTPLSAETILMEGARMVDEWPIIERRIPSDRIVLRKTPAAEDAAASGSVAEPESPPEELSLDIDLGVALDLEPQEAEGESAPEPDPSTVHQPVVKLSAEERLVLALVDGKRTVREIIDLLSLPEFETYRALSDMVTRKLVERVEAVAAKAAKRRRLLPVLGGWVAKLAIAAAVLHALATLPSNPVTPGRLLGASPTTERLRLHAAMARFERIERAVQVFYLDAGTFPPNLPTLVQAGYLDRSALTDPWGRPYRFSISPGGYQLQGQDADGAPLPELSLSRTFSEMQRLLIAEEKPAP
jgi:predicted transcriptional regulator